MTIAFTICSINYLAQAQALGKSLLKYNSDYKYIIALLDRIEGNEQLCETIPYEILEVDKISIQRFEDMYSNYEITELNTAVKPFYIDYFLKEYPEVQSVIYLDPDILIFNKFSDLEEKLQNYNVVVTPHFFTPIYDDKKLTEMDILNAGIYNLGFLAVSNTEETKKFIDWWKVKLQKYCRIAFCEGMFVDQLWINFVPIYFDKVHIFKHLGYNVAYWNLHERTINESNDGYYVNDLYPLVFFHYSGYNINTPNILSKHQTRFSLSERRDIVDLFALYQRELLNNNYALFSKVKCYYLDIYEEKHQKIVEEQQKKLQEEKNLKRVLAQEYSKKNQRLMPTIKRIIRRLSNLV